MVLVDGRLTLYVERGGRTLLSWTTEPARLQAAADALALAVREGGLGRLAVERADGESVHAPSAALRRPRGRPASGPPPAACACAPEVSVATRCCCPQHLVARLGRRGSGADVTDWSIWQPGDPRLRRRCCRCCVSCALTWTSELRGGVRGGPPAGPASRPGTGRCVGVAGWRLVATTHVLRKLVRRRPGRPPPRPAPAASGHALLAELDRRAGPPAAPRSTSTPACTASPRTASTSRERMASPAHHFVKDSAGRVLPVRPATRPPSGGAGDASRRQD